MLNLIRSIIIYLCLPQLSIALPRLDAHIQSARSLHVRKPPVRWLSSVESFVSAVDVVDAFVWLAVLITRQQQRISSIRRVVCKACYRILQRCVASPCLVWACLLLSGNDMLLRWKGFISLPSCWVLNGWRVNADGGTLNALYGLTLRSSQLAMSHRHTSPCKLQLINWST